MYNVNIYPECENEEEYAVIFSAVSEFMDRNINSAGDFLVRKLRRTGVNVSDWGALSRHERFENKF